MAVIFREWGVPAPPRSTARCARCGRTSEVPFAKRPPCACGCRAWTCGPAMGWPPYVLGGEVSPYFVLGSLPLPGGRLNLAAPDERRAAHRVRARREEAS